MVGSIHDTMAIRGILDHDIFMDEHDRIYFVLGHYQPRDRIISLLKYVPDEQGTWVHKITEQKYARTYWHQGIDAFTSAERNASNLGSSDISSWQVVDPVFGTLFMEVPRENVVEYLIPEERLAGILESRAVELDNIEKRVKLVVQAILKHARDIDLVAEDIGVTGSILWRGHSSRSDINLNVYGTQKCMALERVLVDLARRDIVLARGLMVAMKGFDDVPEILCSSKIARSSLMRKPKLKLDGFKSGIQIRWCLKQGEFPIVYGEETYIEKGLVTVRARVTDDAFTLYYPAIVRIETLHGEISVNRIMIYDTRFTRLFRAGDEVEITGLLQEIKPSGQHQVLIGSKQHAGKERVIFLETGRKS
jgi:predicted nucleotidyltransferase